MDIKPLTIYFPPELTPDEATKTRWLIHEFLLAFESRYHDELEKHRMMTEATDTEDDWGHSPFEDLEEVDF